MIDKELTTRFEAYLKDLMGKNDNSVYDAMNYSLSAGGKRIRPYLAMLACRALGGKAEDVFPFATAIEMVHTYSLIHDDLPAMDNDDLRRGKPTSHKVYGEAMAILAGDALLTEAFSVIAESDLSADKKIRAAGALSKRAGAKGMVLGQALDMKGSESLDGLLLMYERKTSDLLAAALSMGAIAAGGKGDEFDTFAKYTGIAFQVMDDILDVTSSEEKLGKNINSDGKNDKITSLSFMTMEDAKNMLEDYTARAVDSLAFLGDKDKELKELAYFLMKRDY
ncbi:MAG: polyprenyl synthetase family protein [Clostridia bacterium]|nr:polyprenyl synthetase family protein [Clostridia bacterium]